MLGRGRLLCPMVLLLRAAAVGAAGDDASSAFWADLQRRGLLVKVADAAAAATPGGEQVGRASCGAEPDPEAEESQERGECEALPSSGEAVLPRDVFYGRPILRLPPEAVIRPAEVSLSVNASAGPPPDASTLERVGLALALLLEHRRPASPFRPWLDAVLSEPLPPALVLTSRQRRALAGTTVEALDVRLLGERALVAEAAAAAGATVPTEEEAALALGAVLRHAVPIEAPPGGKAAAGMVLVPLVQALRIRRDANLSVAAPLVPANFTPSSEGSTPGPVLLHRARRDMRAGEPALPLWLGRLSNSELALRRGARSERNPVGIGGNLTLPPNWSPNQHTPNFKEFKKYNCSSPEAFEIRVSPKGWPMRSYVRCARVAQHLKQGTYQKSWTDRLALLDKWPPPRKYDIQDWLAWTQADQVINKAIYSYCLDMKRQLKETITTAVAEDFRRSTDPVDALLWRLRSEETRTFRECVALAKATEVSTS